LAKRLEQGDWAPADEHASTLLSKAGQFLTPAQETDLVMLGLAAAAASGEPARVSGYLPTANALLATGQATRPAHLHARIISSLRAVEDYEGAIAAGSSYLAFAEAAQGKDSIMAVNARIFVA